MKEKKKNFVIIYENFLYGGTTTHLINLVTSESFKNFNITIITNQNNVGVNDIKRNIKSKKVKLVFLDTLNGFIGKNFLIKSIILFFKPLLFIISIFQFKKYLKVIDYDILLAQYGTSSKIDAVEKLPSLDTLISYPTLIVVDKNKKVRRIHTGFNGPATGDNYYNFKKDFEAFLEKVIAE